MSRQTFSNNSSSNAAAAAAAHRSRATTKPRVRIKQREVKLLGATQKPELMRKDKEKKAIFLSVGFIFITIGSQIINDVWDHSFTHIHTHKHIRNINVKFTWKPA